MAEKNKIVALTISFIFTGLGIAYLGDIRRGVMLFAIAIFLNCFGMWISSIFAYIGILVWAYGLYMTWQEAEKI
jgi:TM2 domain-containing membrane protein YozV